MSSDTLISTEARLPKLDAAGAALLFHEARTANTFADIAVSDDELRAIWDLAKWPPTAANTEPMRVLFVRPGAGRERLVAHMSDGNKAKTLTAPAVAVLALDTQFYEHIPTLMPFRPEMRDVIAANPTVADSMGRFSASLQAGYFMLAIRARGLAAGPMGGFDGAALNAEFFPDGRWQALVVINIGHPGAEAWMPRLPRLEDDEVIHWA